jgi:hypothetical protein
MTSLRMEPVRMILGESAGAAEAFALRDGLPVQPVGYPRRRQRLLARGKELARPIARGGLRPGSPGAFQLRAVLDPPRLRVLFPMWPACLPRGCGLGPASAGHRLPRVQELCALYALRGPTAQGADDFRRLTGLPLDPSTVDREARRQGERAQALRARDMALSQTAEGIAQLAKSAAGGTKHQTLVIETDAWNIRERDNWGQSAQLRRRGQEPNRWHWVLTGTIFRLDHRGKTRAGRPFITERGFVATRQGLDAFCQQLYAEALRCGLSQARDVLVVADGAVWIWNLVDDRFPGARQRVDLYHVKEHLWALAHEVFGQGTEEAHAWVRPLIRMLERRTDGALDVIHGLEGLLTTLEQLTTEQRTTVKREIGYFNQHQRRMDYKQAARLRQPLGSGAIESTCSQYPRRLKLTGQFWSPAGDEAFLALFTLHRNGHWHLLFPHDHAGS